MKGKETDYSITQAEWASLSPTEKLEYRKALRQLNLPLNIPTVTIEETANIAILNGLSNDEVLLEVFKEHPSARTSMASIAYYRNKLREEGHVFPQLRMGPHT